VLLNIAMGGNALLWEPKFVRAFVEHGYQVIRYDYRGTGMSDWMKDWNRNNPYSLVDMADDAIAVLDALEINRAHLVGLSMGGMIAQEIAIHHPERVASLTLIMTSGFVADPDLPGLTSRYFLNKLLTGLPLLRYRLAGGEKNLLKEPIAKMISTGIDMGLDIKETAELVLYDLRKRRGINMRALFQHQTAVSITASRYEQLKLLNMPTLVIHGTNDEFVPVAHGKKLVELIPGAKGLWLEGAEHLFPLPDRDRWMNAILRHLDSA
jgi:pimeloyl-ACP methyl ester carboxylesterase